MKRTELLKPRKKKCPICREYFQPMNSLQKVCSPRCSLIHVERNKRREKKAALTKRKVELKTRAEHMREAQTAFNAWVRERDHGQPCISCERHHEGQWHAGHYRTVAGSPELRFEPLNVHKQCAPCNNHKSGDIVNYRISLVAKIGAESVAWLEGPHDPKKYTIEELKEIKAHYRAEIRKLKKARGV